MRPLRVLALILSIAGALSIAGVHARAATDDADGTRRVPSSSPTFVGSTPCGETVRGWLAIAPDAPCDLIEWKLRLQASSKLVPAPWAYELRYEYGATRQGRPGIGRGARAVTRRGTWQHGRGDGSDPDALVYSLDNGLSLVAIDAQVLHVLDSDGTLMVGNGGWSYTLNRADSLETNDRRLFERSQPERSYPISELASGPTVFGVFEGRSPCQRIARQLEVVVQPSCQKAKWRVTLFQDPDTRAPAAYKVEGSLQLLGARHGAWSMARGTPLDPDAVVYRLAPGAGEQPLWLLKGDDNVLFFLDATLRPLVGHAGFSYTLNRRHSSSVRTTASSSDALRAPGISRLTLAGRTRLTAALCEMT